MTSGDEFISLNEDEPKVVLGDAWRILIADDDDEVHQSTRLALKHDVILGRPLEFLSAYSANEAQTILSEQEGIAAILLDVVMETDDAGLRLVRTIRRELGNAEIRIILRTGQPGYAPEFDVINAYDINDYAAKGALTRNKLYTKLTTALRSYDQIHSLGAARRSTELVLKALHEVSHSHAIKPSGTDLTKQLSSLLRGDITQRTEAELAVQRLVAELEDSVAERTAQFEAALRDAEAANAAKSRFLAVMSHEIRTPINGIVGMLELLERQPLTDEQRHMLATTHYSARVLLHVINDILDFSKIDGGHLELENAPFSVARVTTDVASTMEGMARHHGIELHAHIGEQLPPAVIGDALRTSQILMNLISNAIKFSPRGGSVKVSAECISGDAAGIAWVRLVVTDSGPGIPEAVRAKLFTPFTQADNSIARQFGGTGLGLAICQRLTNLMGGAIDTDSPPGQGATFTVLLPLATTDISALPADGHLLHVTVPLPPPVVAASVASSASARALPRIAAGPILLVAEDNAINRDLISRQLDELGYDYDLVDDGAAALRLFDPRRHQLILTDCEMPVMDGFALARALRKQEATRDPGGNRHPIVALTAHVLAGEAVRCREAGMDDVIIKPASLLMLGERLRHWLQQSTMEAFPVDSAHAINHPEDQQTTLLDFDPAALPRFVGADLNAQVRFLRKFARSLANWRPLIQQQRQSGEWDGVRADAHRMKSTANAVGALRLADHCQRIEYAVREGDVACAARLETEIDALLAALAPALAQRGIELELPG